MTEVDHSAPSVAEQARVAEQLVALLLRGHVADLPPIRWTVREDALLIVGNVQPCAVEDRRRVWARWADVAGLGERTETNAGCGWAQLLAVVPGSRSGAPATVRVIAYVRGDEPGVGS